MENEITLEDIRRVKLEENDVLLITLPEETKRFPSHKLYERIQSLKNEIKKIFNNKVIIVPYGTKIETLDISDEKSG